MICLAVTHMIKPGHETQVIELLGKLAREPRKEPGNILYLAHRSTTEPRRFLLYEQYTDQAALDAHRSTLHFARYATNGIFPLLESRVPELYELLS